MIQIAVIYLALFVTVAMFCLTVYLFIKDIREQRKQDRQAYGDKTTAKHKKGPQ